MTNLKLVKGEVPEKITTTRHGVDVYVTDEEMCQEHAYRGQGWPIACKSAEEGCAACYAIWRVTHINPRTERAGA